MRETLRLYPIAASVMRRPTADVTIAGYRIPAETPCILSLQSVGICREVCCSGFQFSFLSFQFLFSFLLLFLLALS